MSEEYKTYFQALTAGVESLYRIAEEARSKGLDPSLDVEPQITRDIAERIESMIGPQGVGARIRELGDMDRREMGFKIAEEIALGRFGSLDRLEAADKGIRAGLAIMTEGVTVAPIQGIPEVKIKKNQDGSEYLSVYYAGPIRPAGGTEQALTLVLADIVRRQLGLSEFDASEDIIGRFIEEVRLYESEVRRFQYHVTDEELGIALRNLSCEATGVSTDPYEVANYRNIVGIETNRLRGGALIVVVDGIVGRAQKLIGITQKLSLPGWEWLSKIAGKKKDDEGKTAPTARYMEEIIVGRPVFSFPNAPGGFRLRYGRARTTGLAAVGVHPASMVVANRFMCTGLQLRMELPGKSASVCPVTSVEPPVVKLGDGTVLHVESETQAEEIYEDIVEILSLGDMIVNAGDFIQNNKNLYKSGYDENQWHYDLKAKLDLTDFDALRGLAGERIQQFLNDRQLKPEPMEALALARAGIPLHPLYTYPWNYVEPEDIISLRRDMKNMSWEASKRTLEILLIPHKVKDDQLDLGSLEPIIRTCLNLDAMEPLDYDSSLDLIRRLSGLDVRDKAPVHIGARMGRPEKAKERKMSPYIHSLFPVGQDGGPQRNLLKVPRGKTTRAEIVNRQCMNCGAPNLTVRCLDCGGDTELKLRCPRCGRSLDRDTCPKCNVDAVASHFVDLDLYGMFNRAWRNVTQGNGFTQRPSRIKCVKGLLNRHKVPEPIEKGILRAKYDLSVFKDGTLRYDLTDIPLTHFKPGEVGVSVDHLRELGYQYDIRGEPLVNPEQMLELKVQDIVLPEACGDYLVKASKFVDDLLVHYYGMKPHYMITNRDEVVGQLILGLAPHISAATVGRVIGWTKIRSCYAHPLWHAAKRRNCDGDEDAIMLLLDPLLNFSRFFLPEQSGGLMDAPLYVIPNLNPSEVDKEAHNVDVMSAYPPEFYRLCNEEASPTKYSKLIDTTGRRLGTEAQFQGQCYTEECSDINLGSHVGAYNRLKTMLDKLDSQLELSEKIRAVNAEFVAQKILTSHFMKDIAGNLRAFTNQKVRCVKCNRKYRRPPLKGSCVRCGGKLLMTVHKGGIEKYITPAEDLVEKFNLHRYYLDRLKLIRKELASLFPSVEEQVVEDDNRQISLTSFMKRKGS
jgi:DNA polymerase II large subunit